MITPQMFNKFELSQTVGQGLLKIGSELPPYFYSSTYTFLRQFSFWEQIKCIGIPYLKQEKGRF